MKRYHVYGIGNALVDMEFDTTDDELNQLGIDKGRMTLVDSKRQMELLVHFGEQSRKRACGGSAANTVIGATQLGSNCFYSCQVANDDTGNFYLEDLQRNGVDSNLQGATLPTGATGTCLVFITPDAERSMNTFLGITENLSEGALDEKSIQNSEYLYMEGYLVTSPTGRQAAIRAREIAEKANVKTALTFSDQNMVEFFRDGMKEMLGGGVDLLFANRSEALLFAETQDIEKAIEKIKTFTKTFAITLGEKGAIVFDGQKTETVQAFPVDAIDTNGAGDLFAGAFLSAITSGKTYAEAAKLANFASSRLVGKYGPRLDPREIEVVKKFRSENL